MNTKDTEKALRKARDDGACTKVLMHLSFAHGMAVGAGAARKALEVPGVVNRKTLELVADALEEGASNEAASVGFFAEEES